MKYLRSYENIFPYFKTLSKVTTFFMIVIFLTEVFRDVFFFLFSSDKNWLRGNLTQTAVGDCFLLLIGSVFIIRFIFLWSEKTKSVWFSQLFWLFGFLAIFAYRWTTATVWGDLDGSVSLITENYVGSTNGTAQILTFYFFLSPLKQLLVIVSSIFAENIPDL